MNGRRSVATIQVPEFINLQPNEISPQMSKCDVKVFYLGQNRNGSAINKQTAMEMAKTLRGCPIVGVYSEQKQDFGDHGDQIIIDGDGIKFNTLTKPYGFVAPDAKVWFQFFEDTDEFGNTCMREYLMTTGYLWTEQFPECKRVINEHNPQSMELDSSTMKGHWATDNNSNLDFFIIDDAIFSKLCILGEDVEPCFEGSMFVEPTMSSSFSKDNDFMKSLFTMMEELKFALNKNNEGGLPMENQVNGNANANTEEQFSQVNPEEQTSQVTSSTLDNSVSNDAGENGNSTEGFKKTEKEDDGEKKGTTEEGGEEGKKEDPESKPADDDEEEKKKAEKNALETELTQVKADFAALQEKFADMEQKYNELVAFKLEVDNAKKDELINSFYYLSDEDKADVIANKANYSLDEIESKLSIICVRKKVSFAEEPNTDNKPQVVTTFNLNETESGETLPAWLQAVEAYKQSKENN